MKITKYGVTLNRLTENKIELVRSWRNDPKIAQYMEYREHISAEMQQRWFESIDNENNYYFIIEYNNEEVGLINIRDIDYEAKTGEGGIFIYSDELLNSTISFQSVFNLMDFAFDTLKLDYMLARILKTNKRAIQYNKAFGYKLRDDQDEVANQWYDLHREDYMNKSRKIIKLLNL